MFDGAPQPRDSDGKFGEKTGLAPEVDLGFPDSDDEWERPVARYLITAHNLEAFDARIAKANARLEKNGIAERFVPASMEREVRKNADGTETEVWAIELNQPSISHEGWEFQAYHRVLESGDYMTHSQGRDIATPTDARCDHCKVSRHRGKLYTIQNEKTGETMQVGSTCLEPFFGVKPEGLWALTDSVTDDLEAYSYQANAPRDPRSTLIPVDDVLLAAYRATENGTRYVSRDKAMQYGGTPTAATLSMQFGALTASEASDEEEAYVAGLRKYIDELPGDSEYERNLKAAVQDFGDGGSLRVSGKDMALVASSVAGFSASAARVERQAARDAINATKKKAYLAPPQAKIADVPAKVTGIFSYENDYGVQNIVTMQDEEGHVIVWKTGTNPNVETGDDITVKGTVKANEVYRDDWQTVITRAKLEPRG